MDIDAWGRRRLHLFWPVKICIKQNKNKKHGMGNTKSLIGGVFPNISFTSDLRDLLRWKMCSTFVSL